MNYTQNQKIEQVTESTLALGVDIGSSEHYVRAFDYRGRELTRKVFRFSTDINGFNSFYDWVTQICIKHGSADAIYQYTDFGETMIQGYDQSTGLYYLNARYYNPEDGRFLTEDTYHGENDKPDTQHLYVYCANNPVNYVDPSGHYAVALYTLVKIVAGGVVFYVSYSTWKRRRIKTRYATRILNEKYGKGNWGKGPGSEYSRIIKYHRK